MTYLIVGEVTMLEHVREQFTWRFVVKSGNVSRAWVRATGTFPQTNKVSRQCGMAS